MTSPDEKKEAVNTGEQKAPESSDKAKKAAEEKPQSIGEKVEQLPDEDKPGFAKDYSNEVQDPEIWNNLSDACKRRLRPPDGKGDFNTGKALACLGGKKTREAYKKANVISEDGMLKPPEEETDDENTDTNMDIPERQPGSKTGSQLLKEWGGTKGLNRDMNEVVTVNGKKMTMQEFLVQQIVKEIKNGNVPDSSRSMRTITMKGADGTKISFRTSNNFLAVGSNDDNFPIAMSGPMGQEIMKQLNGTLLTVSMAKTRDSQADVTLTTGGETPTKASLKTMAQLGHMERHNNRVARAIEVQRNKINAERQGKGLPALSKAEFSKTHLISGHKKYVCLGQRANSGPILIMGFAKTHKGTVRPGQDYIQSGQYCHTGLGPTESDGQRKVGTHGDYSQASPLTDNQVTIVDSKGKSQTMPLAKALQIPEYAKILNASEVSRTNDGTFDPKKNYGRMSFADYQKANAGKRTTRAGQYS
jgi:hypothetical protein